MSEENLNETPPEPPKNEAPEPPKNDPPEPPKNDSPEPDWKGLFEALDSKMDELAGAIAALAPLPNESVEDEVVPDDSPVKPPWTHRKLFG